MLAWPDAATARVHGLPPWDTYQTALQSCYQFLITYGLSNTLLIQPASVAVYLSHL